MTVKPASTVVLIRDSEQGIEVFLVRRHAGLAFMGGAHVFPGGQLDEGDRATAHSGLSDDIHIATSRLTDVDNATALAFHVAAVRETFEESGVRLALDSLVYFAWWVTPEFEHRRFDTRFFLAPAPPDQVAAHDEGETTEGVWVRPVDALAQCLRDEMALAPPTWTTLRWLEPFGDADAALLWARTRPVHRIQPVVVDQGEARLVTLPDAATLPGVAAERRFLLKAGRWRPLGANEEI